jgi:PAS domain S-box-containing protein
MRLGKLLKSPYFWCAAVAAALAAIFSFAPQLTELFGFSIQKDWQVAYYTAAYRLLFPIAILFAAWRFGVKGGLFVCLITAPVIVSSVVVNSRLPNAWLDVGDIAVGIVLSWLVGKRGEMKQRLEENTVELKRQSARLLSEIAERKQAEEKIERAAAQWQTTFDSISDWIYIVDNDFKLIKVNKAFADAIGKSPQDLIGELCYKIVHKTSEPMPSCFHRYIVQTGKPISVERFEPSLGVDLDITASPIFDEKGDVSGSVHITRDITERRRMRERLMLTDRLASIGELASGIAHEINNPLTGIITFSQLLMNKGVPDDMKEDISIINSEARRTAEIVQNLLTFARKHPPVKQLTRIHEVIDGVLKLRDHDQQLHNIQVRRQFAPDLPEIMMDYFQMQQVFFNIIINAEFFMTQAHDGGTLTITTEKKDGIIRIVFADDGPGIQKGDLSRVFSPFFTTKEVGRGTGLGLSICHGIVSEHNGRIYAESQPGQGAVFVIELPVV